MSPRSDARSRRENREVVLVPPTREERPSVEDEGIEAGAVVPEEPEESPEGIRSISPEEELARLDGALRSEEPLAPWSRLFLGFDLGTTNMVLVALNERGEPVTAVLEPSRSSVRDGVVVDYMAALHGMEKCLARLSRRLGSDELVKFGVGAAAYPPGISERTAKVCANVVESLGFDCKGLYEEPAAASASLEMTDGAIVDIGGGTTGISVLEAGRVVYSADEPTGGTHMTLVLAGALGIDFDEAETVKRNRKNQERYVHLLKPVLEKMGTIVRTHLRRSGYWGRVPVVVCGGGADLPGAEEILSRTVEQPVRLAPYPLLVTPAGIAKSLFRDLHG
jgi:ethanolamine utilization protein EutJ